MISTKSTHQTWVIEGKKRKKLIRKSIDQLNFYVCMAFWTTFMPPPKQPLWPSGVSVSSDVVCCVDTTTTDSSGNWVLTHSLPACLSASHTDQSAAGLTRLSRVLPLHLKWSVTTLYCRCRGYSIKTKLSGGFFCVEMEIPQWCTDRQVPSMVNI